ncbi:Snf7-domain-containing protein [Biscogniauxia marginata]|nr:Snf7-domain-containing protein [Biscogniauxia marginata]
MSELLDYLVQNDQNFRRARLPALYSDFRSQRTLNPDGYTANVSAWKQGLAHAALAGRAPSASKSPTHNHLLLEPDGDAFLRALESKQFGRPLALGTALQDALAAGELLPLSQFLAARQSIYTSKSSTTSFASWASIPFAVLGWGLRQIGLVAGGGGGAGEDTIPRGQFVVLQNLEIAGKAFVDTAADRTSPFERTFSKTQFRRTFEGSLLEGRRLSEMDLEVLVKFLSHDKGILVTDGNTIKIRNPEDADVITEEDSAIASLKELTEDLAQQTEVLSRRVDELGLAAQDAVRRKNRVAALAALRSKKRAEAHLATRHATLSQLEDVATKMQQAADNVQLVRVMRSSTAALRGLNARVGGAEKVEEVLDGLREQMGEVDEVGNIIAEVGAGAGVVDEVEVDDEFEAMLAEERNKEEEAERIKEAQQEKEAEETRRKLAELEKLAPVPVGAVGEKEENRPPTPVAGAVSELGAMHLDTTDGSEKTAQVAAN